MCITHIFPSRLIVFMSSILVFLSMFRSSILIFFFNLFGVSFASVYQLKGFCRSLIGLSLAVSDEELCCLSLFVGVQAFHP